MYKNLYYNLLKNQKYKPRFFYMRLIGLGCTAIGLLASAQAFAQVPTCTGAAALDTESRLTTPDQTLNLGQTFTTTTGMTCNVVLAGGPSTLIVDTNTVIGNAIMDGSSILRVLAGARILGYIEAGEFLRSSDGTERLRGGAGAINIFDNAIVGTILTGESSSLSARGNDNNTVTIGRIVTSAINTNIFNAIIDTQHDLQVGTPLLDKGAVLIRGGTVNIEQTSIFNTSNPGRYAVLLDNDPNRARPMIVALTDVTIDRTSFGVGASNDFDRVMRLRLGGVAVQGAQTEIAMDLRNSASTTGTIDVVIDGGGQILRSSLTGLIGMRLEAATSGITVVTTFVDITGRAGAATAEVTRPGVGVLASGPIEALFSNRTVITGATNGIYIHGSAFTGTSGPVLSLNADASVTGIAGSAIVVDGTGGRTDASIRMQDTIVLSGANNRLLDTINGGTVQVSAEGVVLNGDFVADANSTMNIRMTRNTSMAGNIVLGNNVVVDDGAVWNVAGASSASNLVIGEAGTGTVNLGGQASFTSANPVIIAQNAGSAGSLNIGADPGTSTPPVAPGALNVPAITFGAGAGALNFNHNSDSYVFNPIMTGNGTINQFAGKTILNNNNNGFTGTANVRGGILAVNGTLGGRMDVIGGRLQGTGTIGSTTNQANGTIAPGNGGFDRLTINGNYIGNGGTVELVTVLGDDSSQTSQLVVMNDTSGTSNVRVINQGGAGAQTINGIKVIDVGGASNGTFNLLGNAVTKEGEQSIVQGLFAYTLQKNGVSTTDGNWYLRSSLVTSPSEGDPETPPAPRLNPGAPIYEAYAQTLQVLNKLPTLQQRVGNRFWSNAGNPVMEQGADALGTPYVPAAEAGVVVDSHGVWGRIEGARNHFEPKNSPTDLRQNINSLIMQAGIDGLLSETESGRLIGGITAQYGKAKSNITSPHGDGDIDTNGWGLGGTLTWYGDNGFYLDAQGQAMWYKSDLNSSTNNLSLTNGNKGTGYGLSLEGGQRVDIDAYWSLTPQAQLTWSSVKFDAFNGAWATSVDLNNGNSLNARFGISADYRNAWQASNGMINRTNVYAIANIYQELMNSSKVNVVGVEFENDIDKTWGGIGAGGTYAWADDKYALYGEGSVNTSLSNFAKSYSLKGTVGLRIKW